MRSKKQVMGGESGRSMLETLGVLAMMGLLAIGGVMAYRYAVTKYQANETFNELRRRVIVHSQQSIVGTPLSQVELGDKTQLGYPIAVAAIEKGFFELTVSAMDKDLCREVVRTGWTLPIQTRVNGVVVGTNPAACGEENTIIFRFQTEMGGCKTDEECPCGTCANGVCQTSCSNGESCVKDFNDGQYVCCPGGKVVGNSCCEYPGENGTCCDENSANCCPPDKPVIDWYGQCHSCDEERILNVGYYGQNREVICNRCPSHIYLPNAWGHQHCVLPCPADKPLMDAEGVCYACDDSRGYIYMNNSLSVSSCSKCPGSWVHTGGNSDGSFFYYLYGCMRCDSNIQSISMGDVSYMNTENIQMAVSACQSCPNRTLVDGRRYGGNDSGGYGSLWCAKPCEQGFVLDGSGQCRECQSNGFFDVRGVYESCYNCEGHFLGTAREDGMHYYYLMGCHRCDSDIQSISLATAWANKTESNTAARVGCNRCRERQVVNEHCAKYCENGKIWDNKGECHTCDEEADFNVQGVPENKCACPGVRYLDGNICKKCPEDVSALTPAQRAQCGK